MEAFDDAVRNYHIVLSFEYPIKHEQRHIEQLFVAGIKVIELAQDNGMRTEELPTNDEELHRMVMKSIEFMKHYNQG